MVIADNHDANYINNKLNLSAVLVLEIPSKTYYVVKEIGWVDREMDSFINRKVSVRL